MNEVLVSIEMKQKRFKMVDSKKKKISSFFNSKYFFMKISRIGPWVSRMA